MKHIIFILLIALTANGADTNIQSKVMPPMMNETIDGERLKRLNLMIISITNPIVANGHFTNSSTFSQAEEKVRFKLPMIGSEQRDLTNLVNTLATSGEFCRVRGHVWQDYKPRAPMTNTIVYLNGTFRKCAVCTNVQTLTYDWK